MAYQYKERLTSTGQIQIEPEWGGWYTVSPVNADKLRSAAALGIPGMTEFFAVIDADGTISKFSVWDTDPLTGESTLKPWEPPPAPTVTTVDPRIARAMQLGYGPNPTEEMLQAADQGIAYEDWRAQKLNGGTPGGTAIGSFGVGGPTSQPTSYPLPTYVPATGPAPTPAGPANLVEQTTTGGAAFNLSESLGKIPMLVWVVLGVLVAVLVLRRK